MGLTNRKPWLMLFFFESLAVGCQNTHARLGRIIVHDRLRVESQVLPKYFNHSSFASLRRQLNYFSFVRIGKGRQRGASTYCNEAVIQLRDILRLKRRTVGAAILPAKEEDVLTHSIVDSNHDPSVSSKSRSSTVINTIVPCVHLPASKRVRPQQLRLQSRTKKHRKSISSTPIISPLSSSPAHCFSDEDEHAEPRIMLDLTVPFRQASESCVFSDRVHATISARESVSQGNSEPNDEDILAGCNALLSFASSAANHPVVGTS